MMSPPRGLLRYLALAAALGAAPAAAQTPSPFTNWQNDAGIVLAPLGGPIPDWRVTLGMGAAALPLYEGADKYRIQPSPAFDIRYRDDFFLSSGDGLGVNLVKGETYRAGVSLNYDIGRNAHLSGRLNGLGNVEPAPEARLFAEATFLPFVFNADLRRGLGGHNGFIGDLGIYLPVVGNETLVIFVGPSVTFADQRYMRAYFGVDPTQSLESRMHFPVYQPDGGLKNVSFGGNAIYHFTDQWFIDGDIAWERLAGSAGNSPIVQDKDQLGVSVIVGYQF